MFLPHRFPFSSPLYYFPLFFSSQPFPSAPLQFALPLLIPFLFRLFPSMHSFPLSSLFLPPPFLSCPHLLFFLLSATCGAISMATRGGDMCCRQAGNGGRDGRNIRRSPTVHFVVSLCLWKCWRLLLLLPLSSLSVKGKTVEKSDGACFPFFCNG